MEYNFVSNSIVDTYIDTGVENVFNTLDDSLFVSVGKPGYIRKTEIKEVIFNDPATIVKWMDGTKTVVKCQEDDTYSKHVGLAMCITKKVLGNKSNFNNIFTKWCTEDEE